MVLPSLSIIKLPRTHNGMGTFCVINPTVWRSVENPRAIITVLEQFGLNLVGVLTFLPVCRWGSIGLPEYGYDIDSLTKCLSRLSSTTISRSWHEGCLFSWNKKRDKHEMEAKQQSVTTMDNADHRFPIFVLQVQPNRSISQLQTISTTSYSPASMIPGVLGCKAALWDRHRSKMMDEVTPEWVLRVQGRYPAGSVRPAAKDRRKLGAKSRAGKQVRLEDTNLLLPA